MRWPLRRRRPAPMPDLATRLPDGRLVDGDTVRLPGQLSWADLLDQDGTPPPAALRDALTEAPQLLPVVPPASQRRRRRGGGRR